MKFAFSILIILSSQNLYSQKKFQIIYQNDDYYTSIIADKNGTVIKKLDSAVYGLNYRPGTMGYFSIFSIKGERGWTAIDINGNKLFEVLNTEIGTPSPDDLIENKIRILDNEDKIGFANNRGVIIIKPQFEQASSFHNGKAIIAEKCKNIPWNEHPNESDCHHYTTKCEKHGYINTKGEVLLFGEYTFEEIATKIKWKNDFE